MMKTQIGIGALSIPGAFDVLGLIPGVVTLIAVAIITTWSDYIVGCFKLNHPTVYGLDDSGHIMFGKPGREVFGIAFLLCKSDLECSIHIPSQQHANKTIEQIMYSLQAQAY